MIVILALAMSFASCSTFKNTSKQKNKVEYSIKNKLDSSVTTTIKNDIVVETNSVDTGYIETEYEKETIKNIKGINISAKIKPLDMKKDEKILIIDSLGYRLIAEFNSLSNALELNLSTPDVSEATKEKGKTKEKKGKTDSSKNTDNSRTENKVAVTVRNEEKIKESDSKSRSEPNKNIFIFGVVALIIIFVFIGKQKKPYY